MNGTKGINMSWPIRKHALSIFSCIFCLFNSSGTASLTQKTVVYIKFGFHLLFQQLFFIVRFQVLIVEVVVRISLHGYDVMSSGFREACYLQNVDTSSLTDTASHTTEDMKFKRLSKPCFTSVNI